MANKKFFFSLFLKLLCVVFIIFIIFMAIVYVGNKNTVAVLNYHQINDKDHNSLTVSVDDFEEQMKYLAQNNYNTITPEEMLDAFKNNKPIPDKTVIITFDDGYKDNFDNAYPILKKYNLKATMFVITDYVSLYPNYITWDEAKTMQESGVMNLESHTMDHVNLLKVPKDEAYLQLKDSKMWLEKHLKKPIKFLAYPEGDYDIEIIQILKELGYDGAFTVTYGLAEKNENPYELSRVPIFGVQNGGIKKFKLRLEFAPIFATLENLRNELAKNGFTTIAEFIYVP